MNLIFDTVLCKRQNNLCRLPQFRQLQSIQICFIVLGKPGHENGALACPEKYQRPVSTGLACTFAGNALFQQTAAQIRINQSLFGAADCIAKGVIVNLLFAGELCEPCVLVMRMMPPFSESKCLSVIQSMICQDWRCP